MKNTLLITTFLAASSGVAMATAPLDKVSTGATGHISVLNANSSEWQYRDIQENIYGATYGGQWTGSSIKLDGTHQKGLEHYRSTPMTINLGINARYEFTVEFNLAQSGNGYDLAMGGMYLAGNSGSLYFGNSLESNWDKGAAIVYRYSGDMAEYNDDQNPSIYFPNHDFDAFGAPFNQVDPIPGQKWTVVDGNAYNSGNYKLQIVIEAFESENDMVYFAATTPQGNGVKQGDSLTMSALGFDANASFDAFGFVLHDDNGSKATPVKAMGYEYSRVKREVVPPEQPTPPSPDIPEPSAFGLLAGVGALALVASRRRRSRS